MDGYDELLDASTCLIAAGIRQSKGNITLERIEDGFLVTHPADEERFCVACDAAKRFVRLILEQET